MKLNLSSLWIAILCVTGLSSCNSMGGNSGGTELKEPTVEQMAELEKQWGVKPRESHTRPFLPPSEGTIAAPMQPSPAAPIIVPDPAPLPQTQTAAPPVFETPPAATPAQIQKLKN